MAKNFSGRDYLFYVKATSAPSDATAASGYTIVGDLTSLSINRSRNVLDRSSKDSGDDRELVAGRRSQNVSGSGYFDHTEDAGYTVLSDAYEAADGKVWWLATSTTSGDTEWHGSGVISDLSSTLDDESISSFSFTIESESVTEVAGTST